MPSLQSNHQSRRTLKNVFVTQHHLVDKEERGEDASIIMIPVLQMSYFLLNEGKSGKHTSLKIGYCSVCRASGGA